MKSRASTILIILIVILSSISVWAQNDSDEPYSEVFPVYGPSGVGYDPDILEGFENASEVSIIVKVKDTSDIVVRREDPKDVQRGKDLERKRLFENKVDAILSGLSNSEFSLGRKFITGHGFSGTITRDGFNKLLNNSNVGTIYLNKVSHLAVISEPVDDKEESITEGIIQEKENLNISVLNESMLGNWTGEVEEIEEQTSMSLFSRVIKFFISLFDSQ